MSDKAFNALIDDLWALDKENPFLGQSIEPEPTAPLMKTLSQYGIELHNGVYRIRRPDGGLVGFYESKDLAQKAIDTAGTSTTDPTSLDKTNPLAGRLDLY
jgi:hypothetical protein